MDGPKTLFRMLGPLNFLVEATQNIAVPSEHLSRCRGWQSRD